MFEYQLNSAHFDVPHIIASVLRLANEAKIDCQVWKAKVDTLPEFEAEVRPDGDVLSPELLRKNAIRVIASPASRSLNSLANLRDDSNLSSHAVWTAFADAHPDLASTLGRLIQCAKTGGRAASGKKLRPKEEGPPFLVDDENPAWDWLTEMKRIILALSDTPAPSQANPPFLGLVLDKPNRRISRLGRSGNVEFGGRDLIFQIFIILFLKNINYNDKEILRNSMKFHGFTDMVLDQRIHERIHELRKLLIPLGIDVKNSRTMGYKLSELDNNI